MEKHVVHETTDGTPQGGIIPRALSNCALDKLEQLLRKKFPTKKLFPSLGGKFPAVNLIRYADDFVIAGRTKELLAGEIKPLVEQLLQERGLVKHLKLSFRTANDGRAVINVSKRLTLNVHRLGVDVFLVPLSREQFFSVFVIRNRM